MCLAQLQKPFYVLLLWLLFWHSAEALASNCCQDGETKDDDTNCLNYYICSNGEFVQKSCQSGLYWNSITATCLQNNGQCCSGTATCTENELQVDPQNCAAYYQCIMGELVSQKCASGTYFDTTLKACVVDTECICPS